MIYDINEIKKSGIFQGISKDDLKCLISCIGIQIRKYKKGEFISIESDEVKWINVVISGTVYMIKEDIWGNETLLAVIKDSQIFGETFASSENPVSSVTFCAARETDVLLIPFHRIMHTCTTACVFHHRVIENMVLLISEKNKLLMEKLEIISQKSLRKKLLLFLSIQSRVQGCREFTVDMGRSELANYLCVDRSALSRELSAMKHDGIIDYRKNSFKLLL